MMDCLDCHALVVSTDLARYPLAPEAAPPGPGELEGCTSVAMLQDALREGAIAGAVLVQRNRFHGHDNRLICDLARGEPALRVLCSVDSRREDGAALAAELLEQQGAAGLRFMVPEKGADLGWLAGEHARAVWRVAADAGAVVDVHVFPWNRAGALAELDRLMVDFPDVPVLLDNLGNGPIAAGLADFGIDDLLRAVVDRPGLTVKFSDMTLARIEGAGLDAPAWIARFAALVGTDRLAWGSDVLPAGQTLAMAVERAQAATADLNAADQRAVLRETTGRLFRFGS